MSLHRYSVACCSFHVQQSATTLLKGRWERCWVLGGEAKKLLRPVKHRSKCCYYELFCFWLIIVTDMKSRLCKLKAEVLRKLRSDLVRSASSSFVSPAISKMVSLIFFLICKNKPIIPQL
jgi:hypothetical protein